MAPSKGHIVRQGRIYHFVVDGVNYSAFVWQDGRQFSGRVEDHPQVPQQRARTSLATRDALVAWLTKNKPNESLA